jgi:hypothetical protein
MAFGRKKDTDSLREGLIDSYRFRLTAGNDVARKFWTDGDSVNGHQRRRDC